MERFLAGSTARIALVAFLFFIFIVGCFVAGTALHDPDTCWLLALGRYIWEHGGLPQTDPFSYTFALDGPKPFVMYQWLSELLFYTAYRAASLTGLLIVVALLVSAAFIALPMEMFHRLRFPLLGGAWLTMMTMVAACFHTLARPEAFSYILLALWLRCMWMVRIDDALNLSPNKLLVVPMVAIMVVWCNLHTGFTSGLAILAWYVLASTAEWFLLARRTVFPHATAWTALVLSAVATLINPFGWGLWTYVPGLFFSPINKFIDELRPIGVRELGEWTYYPFFILCLVTIVLYALSFKRLKAATTPRYWNLFYTPVIIAFVMYEGLTFRRLIPFAALVLAFECAGLWPKERAAAVKKQAADGDAKDASGKVESETGGDIEAAPGNFWADVEGKFASLLDPSGARWFTTVALLACVGVFFIATKVAPPTLPQESQAFPAPFAAIDYLKKNPPKGNLFNEAQYGDLIIWYMQPGPPVFMDTRFDMYGPGLVTDYAKIRNCREGWEALLEQYKIETAFLRKNCALAEKLLADPKWAKAYDDGHAVVLSKAVK